MTTSPEKLTILAQLRELYEREDELATRQHAAVLSALGLREDLSRGCGVARANIPLLDAALRHAGMHAWDTPTPQQYSAFAYKSSSEENQRFNDGEKEVTLNPTTSATYAAFYQWLGRQGAGGVAWLNSETKAWVIRATGAVAETSTYPFNWAVATSAALRRAAAATGPEPSCAWSFFELILGGVVDLPRGLTKWGTRGTDPPYAKAWTREMRRGERPRPGGPSKQENVPAARILGEVYYIRHQAAWAIAAVADAQRVEHAADLATVALSLYRGVEVERSPSNVGQQAFPPGLQQWATKSRVAQGSVGALYDVLRRHVDGLHTAIWASFLKDVNYLLAHIRPVALERARRCLAWTHPSTTPTDDSLLETWQWPAELRVRVKATLALLQFGLGPFRALTSPPSTTDPDVQSAWADAKKAGWETHRLAISGGPVLAATWLFVATAVLEGAGPGFRRSMFDSQLIHTAAHTPFKQRAEDLAARNGGVPVNADILEQLGDFDQLCQDEKITEKMIVDAEELLRRSGAPDVESLKAQVGVVALPMLLAIYVLHGALTPDPQNGMSVAERSEARVYATRLLRNKRPSGSQKKYAVKSQVSRAGIYLEALGYLSRQPKNPKQKSVPGHHAVSEAADRYVAQIITRLASVVPDAMAPPTAADALALLVAKGSSQPSSTHRQENPMNQLTTLGRLAACSLSRFCDSLPLNLTLAIQESERCELSTAEAALATEAELLRGIGAPLASEFYAAALRSFATWTRQHDDPPQGNPPAQVATAAYRVARALLPPGDDSKSFLLTSCQLSDVTVDTSGVRQVQVDTGKEVIVDGHQVIPRKGASYERAKDRRPDQTRAGNRQPSSDETQGGGLHDERRRNKALRGLVLSNNKIVFVRLARTTEDDSITLGDLQDFAATLDARVTPCNPDPPDDAYLYVRLVPRENIRARAPPSLAPMRSLVANALEVLATEGGVLLHLIGGGDPVGLVNYMLQKFPDLQRAPTYKTIDVAGGELYQLTWELPDSQVCTALAKELAEGQDENDAINKYHGHEKATFYRTSPTPSRLEECFENNFAGAALGTLWFLDSLSGDAGGALADAGLGSPRPPGFGATRDLRNVLGPPHAVTTYYLGIAGKGASESASFRWACCAALLSQEAELIGTGWADEATLNEAIREHAERLETAAGKLAPPTEEENTAALWARHLRALVPKHSGRLGRLDLTVYGLKNEMGASAAAKSVATNGPGALMANGSSSPRTTPEGPSIRAFNLHIARLDGTWRPLWVRA